MQVTKKLSMALLLSWSLATSGLAMEDRRPHRTQEHSAVYQNAAKNTVQRLFAVSKYMDSALQTLTALIDESFDSSLKESRLPYKEHATHYMNALIEATLNRYENERGKFSKGKEALWGTSNTLLILGVLKNVATDLGLDLTPEINDRLATPLSYLRFYYSSYDAWGVLGFDVAAGKFATLAKDTYATYGLCLTYKEIIVDLIKNKQGVTNNREDDFSDFEELLVNKKEIPSVNTTPRKIDHMSDLKKPITPEMIEELKGFNGSEINWDEVDAAFQDGILKLAKAYNLKAFNVKAGSWTEPEMLAKNCSATAQPLDPEAYRRSFENYRNIVQPAKLPPGKYAKPLTCIPWMQHTDMINEAQRKQGIKVHISAKPETALKIAQIVLPILEENNMDYKVMYDLPLMRHLYYLTQYERNEYLIGNDQSTQAGKYIALYPASINAAVNIITKLEAAFREAKLEPNDFVRLAGDAQIGDSGGIFARYGKFANYRHKGRDGSNITPVDELDQSIAPEKLEEQHIKYNPLVGMADERTYPWPDFMNNRDLYKQPLFGSLNVTWINPANPQQVITWETRPNCWAELKGTACK